MAKVETVTIDRDGVAVIINKSDLKPDDVLFGEKPKAAPKPAKKKAVKVGE